MTSAGDWDVPGAAPAADWDAPAAPTSGANWFGAEGANVSKHEDGVAWEGEGAGNDGCRNCGQAGHFARECPEPRKASGACFNCGQEGHTKSDCPNPSVFTGTCRVCEKEGHRANECPDRPPDICKNCKEEGHKAAECTKNRVRDLSGVRDMQAEVAWGLMKKADDDHDLDDFRNAIASYCKAVPDANWNSLEKALRNHGFRVHLIAAEKDILKTQTIINLQGKKDCTYQVQYHWSFTPPRKVVADKWPKTSEENLERLNDAGTVEDRMVMFCSNCDEPGHSAKFCKADKREYVRAEVKCFNCGEVGHRSRDCDKERVDPDACRNCKKSGHNSKECPEPRSAEGVECKRCNEIGHFAKDCPTGGAQGGCRNCGLDGHMAKECTEPRNPDTVTCRNCEKMGHFSKDCPEPKDWSKVICSNCNKPGHTFRRCKEPGADGNNDTGYGGNTDVPTINEPAQDWDTPVVEASGW